VINELIIYGGMKEGIINYDSDTSEIQVKDASLNSIAKNENVLFLNCKISGGIMSGNKFYNCEIDNCIIENSVFRESNKIENCKLKDSDIFNSNTINNSYIEIKGNQLSGEFNNCIFRYDKPSEFSKVSKSLFVSDEIEKFYKEQ
jgi:uncharacterized protein YjbI with pentapeptide repeats